MIALLLAALVPAQAANIDGVDKACREVATEIQNDIGGGATFDEQAQQDFLLNYFALAVSFSPLHSPVPNESGTGAASLELAIIPPLGCKRRLVLGASKTEDTNKAPMAPRPRVGFVFPKVGKVVPYAGLGYVPPITVFGTRNVITSGELGFGIPYENGLEWGMRYHFTLMKTVAEIATPFDKDDPPVDDFYSGSTFGLDLMAGWDFDGLTPYVAMGFTDASTFFYIGDDGIVSNNATPFFGFTGSLGVQWTKDWLDLAGEFYTAPGYLYTGRLRVGVLF
jgi:hypothetical protein